jgi:hypothetical protein
MSPHHDLFLQAIHEKKIVALTFNSIEKGIISRKCICYDYATSNRYKDGNYRYHFHDLDSPDGKHNLSILTEQLLAIEISNEIFEPGDYVKWMPSWSVKRDWGVYS